MRNNCKRCEWAEWMWPNHRRWVAGSSSQRCQRYSSNYLLEHFLCRELIFVFQCLERRVPSVPWTKGFGVINPLRSRRKMEVDWAGIVVEEPCITANVAAFSILQTVTPAEGTSAQTLPAIPKKNKNSDFRISTLDYTTIMGCLLGDRTPCSPLLPSSWVLSWV